MDSFITFEEFLSQSGNTISPVIFAINLLIAAFLSFILKKIYINFGTALSNRDLFSNNFVMITLTTMVVISIVKASLALSLGLVGALSIVRFRAAIKEPEELSYLFLAIAIGLGMGANQVYVTLIGFTLISIIIILSSLFKNKINGSETQSNVYIQITSSDKIDIDKVINLFLLYCESVFLKRLDENEDYIEASFLVKFNNFKELDKAKKDIQQIDPKIKITFLDYNQPI